MIIQKKILFFLILLVKREKNKNLLQFLFFLKQFKNCKFLINKLYIYIYNLFIMNIYKINNYNLYLELNIKKGGLFLYYKGSKIKQRYKNFVLYYEKEKIDYINYKIFFLKKKFYNFRKILLKNSKKKIYKKNKNFYKYYKIIKKSLYKRIFVWPFLITIKPYLIILKNIFFNNYYIIKKKKKRFIFSEFKEKLNNFKLNQGNKIFWYIYNKYILFFNRNKFLLKNKIYLLYIKIYKYFYITKKINKNKFFEFLTYYKKYLKRAFISLSLFYKLYCLYFFWFLYNNNNLYYYINKTLYNLWFRILYFLTMIKNIKYNLYFYNYKNLYNKILLYNQFIEIENKYILFIFNFNKLKNFFMKYINLNLLYNNKNYNNIIMKMNISHNNIIIKNLTLNYYKKILKNIIKKKDLFDIYYYEYYKYNCIYNIEQFKILKYLYFNKYKKIDKTKNTKIFLR